MKTLFRVARPSSTAWIVIKTLAQIVVLWTFALVALPLLAIAIEDAFGIERFTFAAGTALGITLLIAGSALGLAAARVMTAQGRGTPLPFDAASELVVAGPYRVVRNPMAVGGIAQSAGAALVVRSPLACMLPLAGFAMWQYGMRPPEERFLAQRFGEDYERYRAAVRCWVPRWPPYPPQRRRGGG